MLKAGCVVWMALFVAACYVAGPIGGAVVLGIVFLFGTIHTQLEINRKRRA